jgi:hypothetical protein
VSQEPDSASHAAGRGGFGRHWPLLAILALAAAFRLWGLGTQPVLFFDSGVYLGEGIFLASAAERAVGGLTAPGPGSPLDKMARATEQGTLAHPPDIAKPGHAILLALGLLALKGNAVLAGGLVSALAGIGTVAGTYGLGVLGWGKRVAIPAALVLAVSGQHLVYSREPLVEADGLLFATLASLVYLAGTSLKSRLLAGVLFGLAFTCNNRVAYIPLVLALVDLFPWRGLRGLLGWAVPVGVGFALPPGLIELAYLAARGVGRATGAPTSWLDYVQQLVAFSRMNPPDRIRFDEWPTYFVDVALMDGVLILALFLLGTQALLRQGRGSRANRLLLGSLLVPLAIYSIYSTGEVRMRHFSLALPWLALAAAWGMLVLGRLARRPRLVPSVLTGLVVLLALPRAVSLASAPSGMPALLQTLGGQSAASTDGPVLSVFVGEQNTNARLRPAFVDTPADLRDLSGSYALMVVDMQAYLFPGALTERFDAVPPRLSVPHGNDTWYLADLLEHHGVALGGWGDLLDQWAAHRQSASTLRLYTMADLLGR